MTALPRPGLHDEAPRALSGARLIRLLPEAVVNRIAAGEVIERPAAAVKELVENALDAGSTRIAVELEAGGIERIEVSDDGCGMRPDELRLAVQRHATSKLGDEGLVRIATLGFRGEALPSIGAAARLSLVSRPADAPSAHAIRVEGGQVSDVQPAAGTPGTRAVVTDLFWATPARRKFLKPPRTEAEHAEAAVRCLAVAAPHVAFRLRSDGRLVFDRPAEGRERRVAALLGPEAAAALLPVEGDRAVDRAADQAGAGGRGVLRLSGYVCQPAITRRTAAGIHLVVNGRPVADPVLRTALRVAARDVMVPGRHPVAALYLEIPPEEVDVNVHPGKAELRFRDADGVRSLVIGTVGRALAVGAGRAGPGVPGWAGRPEAHVTGYFAPAAANLDGYPARPAPPLRLAYPEPPAAHGSPSPGFAEAMLPLVAPPMARAPMRGLPVPDAAPSGRGTAPGGDLPDGRTVAHADAARYPLGAAVAQVLDTYVLAVSGDGSLVLVDQHAAAERLAHEALRAQHLDGGVRAQPLLQPAVVELPPHDAARLLDAAGALAKLGLEVEGFGSGAVLVRAMPAVLGAADPVPLLRDLADDLSEHGGEHGAEEGGAASLLDRLDAVVARMACHGSLRAGRRLGLEEMDSLLRRMEATPRAATCSHGRPTYLRLSRAELERMFGRR